LKEIGGPGQQRLKAATVALVGVGGLGAPAAFYLAAAGVGRLRLIDHDAVTLSNLQRQILYREADVGRGKVERAAEALRALNGHVEIETCATRLVAGEASPKATEGGAARDLLRGAAIVLDGSDDFATRFAVNAACHDLGVTLVSGAIGRWEGQVATFKSGATKSLPPAERLPCYRCLVPHIPPDAEPCERAGIVGALTGVIGSLMALEAIKQIAEAGDTLEGSVLLFDGLKCEARKLRLRRDPACPVCA
jgi:molybdopterin/thiamine biosynthesis adenylyltransferase